MPSKIINVSDFQRNTKPTFDDISKSKEPVLVMNRSKKVGVFLSPKAYDDFINMYEDYVDSKDLVDAVSKLKNEKTVPLEKLLDDLV